MMTVDLFLQIEPANPNNRMDFLQIGAAVQGFASLSVFVAPNVFDAPFEGWRYWHIPTYPARVSPLTLSAWNNIVCNSTIKGSYGVLIPDGPAWADFPDNVGWGVVQVSIAEQQRRFVALCKQYIPSNDPLHGYIKEYMTDADDWTEQVRRMVEGWTDTALMDGTAPTGENLYMRPIREVTAIDRITNVLWWFDDADEGVRCVYVKRPDAIEQVRRDVERVYDGPLDVRHEVFQTLQYEGGNDDRHYQ